MDLSRSNLIGAHINLISADPKMRAALSSVLDQGVVLRMQRCDGPPWTMDPAEAAILEIDSLCHASAAYGTPHGVSDIRNNEGRLRELFASLIAAAVPVVVMAGDDLRELAQDLVERGAHSYVRNPPVVRDLRSQLLAACESSRMKRDLQEARHKLEALTGLDMLTGSSAPMQHVYNLIRKVAGLEASVLITGESGTGKELIARAIHNTGNRAKRRFVGVSCAAIPETLIESELFGHEKGAFTGSNAAREGYFEQVGDGTLFLDEIGELKPQIQVKLLRVLQEREFSRLGSTRNIPLRARVLLATHRDLGRMVAEGEFRQDLYYRINVINIAAPELRRRPSDIPALATHFAMKYSELFRKPIENIEPEAVSLLQRYAWPGNVRELENVVQRAIILADGYSLRAVDLPCEIQDSELTPLSDDELLPNGTFERLLREYKTKLAFEALQQCHGNKTLAAQSLSISRAYLHRLIRPASAAPEVTVTPIRDACA